MRPSRPLTETKNDTENENTKKKSDKLKVTERERVREKRVGTYKENILGKLLVMYILFEIETII